MNRIDKWNQEIESFLIDLKEVEALDIQGKRVVYQGVEGAYAQQAMLEFFGSDCDGYHVNSWRDAMEEIRKKNAAYAVLPMENSSAGIVSENYDLLAEYDHFIVGEQKLPINHCLLGLPGTRPEEIRKVYSHPQALMQCAGYFNAHREWETIGTINTAVAAKMIKDDGDRGHAAVASRLTAGLYGLEILDEGIQQNRQNTTRFAIVSAKHIYEKKADKVSICFETKHESGSLYHILSHFYILKLNLIGIQSRPIPNRNWEYRFFADFEGSLNDAAVRKVLRRLYEDTRKLRLLGTYH